MSSSPNRKNGPRSFRHPSEPPPGPTIPRAYHVAYIELFFDLIFILALTQLSRHLFDNQSLIGALESAVLGIKKRPYRPVPVADHGGANGVLRATSWRWAVVARTAGAVAAWVALTSSLILAAPDAYVWWMGLGLVGGLVAAVFLIAVVAHPMTDRALL